MKYTKDLLEAVVSESSSVRDVMRRLNIRVNGGAHEYLTKAIRKFNIDCSHFNCGARYRPSFIKKSWKDFLVVGKTIKTEYLRRSLVEYGLEYKCSECSLLPVWNKRPLVLQVDHVDGDNLNNSPGNLRFLCPNCHTQTSNFGSKNAKFRKRPRVCCDCGADIVRGAMRCKKCYGLKRALGAKRPAKSFLSGLIWKIPATQIADQLNVSDRLIGKWCDYYGLQRPGRGYWTKKNKEKSELLSHDVMVT